MSFRLLLLIASMQLGLVFFLCLRTVYETLKRHVKLYRWRKDIVVYLPHLFSPGKVLSDNNKLLLYKLSWA